MMWESNTKTEMELLSWFLLLLFPVFLQAWCACTWKSFGLSMNVRTFYPLYNFENTNSTFSTWNLMTLLLSVSKTWICHDNNKYEHYYVSHSKNCVRASGTNNFYFSIHFVTSRTCENGRSTGAAEKAHWFPIRQIIAPLPTTHFMLQLETNSSIQGLCHLLLFRGLDSWL